MGSTNRRADVARLEELRRSARGRSLDEDPLAEMNSETIDFRAASKCFRAKRRLKPADMRTLGVFAVARHRSIPTVGGLLLFGKDRLTKFPEVYLRARCFAG